MHKVDSPGASPANEFTNGDPQSGVPATTLEAKFMNAVQRELVNVVERGNMQLNDRDDTQVYQAMQSLVQTTLNDTIPPGTRMLFAQAVAPRGWVQDNSQNDRMIRVVRGRGNGIGGSWNITGLSYAHTHDYRGSTSSPKSLVALNYARGNISVTVPAQLATHDIRGTTEPARSSAVSATGSWRPSYLDVIICRKR